MAKPIIEIKNLGKKYRLGAIEPYYSLRDQIAGLFKFARKSKSKGEFWALKDISFSVNEGEVVGIIGRNGAGKSTLLKILSQITPPTTGEITVRGRVASLLEVGTGFHPELTGRENIYLNGAILGMNQKEIKRKFAEIVAFSEIEKFLDTPVKRYSSGMYVRLAFAVAAHLEPEILIVDEVLAVGDIQFQKKCLGKMRDVAKGGRTVLFVSHNLGAVNQLCRSCILLDRGKIIAQGPTAEVTKKYLSMSFEKEGSYSQKSDNSKAMNLRKVYLVNNKGSGASISYDEDIVIRIEYEVNETVNNAIVWIALQNMEGVVAFCSSDYDLNPELRETRKPGYYHAEFAIPKKWLNTNSYDLVVAINTNNTPPVIFERVETIRINVVDNGSTPKSIFNESSRNGVFQPFLKWETTKKK